MLFACNYADRMSMIQIRNVPEGLHRRLKARAAMSGMSLSDLLLQEIAELADRPTLDELRARLAAREPAPAGVSVSAAVRAEREAR